MFRDKIVALLFLLSLFLNYSCNIENDSNLDIKFNRFDKATFIHGVDSLTYLYPTFSPFYLEDIIKVGPPSDSLTGVYFKQFRETYNETVYNTVLDRFPSMDTVEKQLHSGLSNYIEIFPSDSLPLFYTHFSGFNESVIQFENIISVSLENYLGDSPYYDQLGVYKYLRSGMYPEKIPIDIIKIMLLQKIKATNATENLLSSMVYQGKLYYLLQLIFPDENIYDLLNYSKKQKSWLEANEPIMWSYLVEHKHLFSSDYKIIRTYIDPAPFTKYFPTDSPGQTGVWMGYQIIMQYMNNQNPSIGELINNTDYQNILKLSEYNP